MGGPDWEQTQFEPGEEDFGHEGAEEAQEAGGSRTTLGYGKAANQGVANEKDPPTAESFPEVGL